MSDFSAIYYYDLYRYHRNANDGTFELLYTFVSRRANRSVMYIWEARKGVENPWSLSDPAGTFKVLSFRWATVSPLSLSFSSAFSPVFFHLSSSTHIRWRIVLLKRVLLTNGSLFLSLSASSFFLFFFFLSQRRSAAVATITVGDGIPIERLEKTIAWQHGGRPKRPWRTYAEKSRESYDSRGRVRGRGAPFSDRKEVAGERCEKDERKRGKRRRRKSKKFSRMDPSPRSSE